MYKVVLAGAAAAFLASIPAAEAAAPATAGDAVTFCVARQKLDNPNASEAASRPVCQCMMNEYHKGLTPAETPVFDEMMGIMSAPGNEQQRGMTLFTMFGRRNMSEAQMNSFFGKLEAVGGQAQRACGARIPMGPGGR